MKIFKLKIGIKTKNKRIRNGNNHNTQYTVHNRIFGMWWKGHSGGTQVHTVEETPIYTSNILILPNQG